MHSGCLRSARGFHAGLPPRLPSACTAGIVQVVPGGLVGPSAHVLAPSAVVAGQGGGMTGAGGTRGVQVGSHGTPLATTLPWVCWLEAVQDATFSLIELKNAFFSSFFPFIFFISLFMGDFDAFLLQLFIHLDNPAC